MSETWTRDDAQTAQAEGWNVFDAEGELQVQRVDAPENDDAPYLQDDDEAHEIVFRKARQGSLLHQKALRCVSEKERSLISKHQPETRD